MRFGGKCDYFCGSKRSILFEAEAEFVAVVCGGLRVCSPPLFVRIESLFVAVVCGGLRVCLSLLFVGFRVLVLRFFTVQNN